MPEGGGEKLFLVGCGCLGVSFGALIIIISIIAAFIEPNEENDNLLQLLDSELLTEEGKSFFERNKTEIEGIFIPVSSQSGIHWTVLTAIRKQRVKGDLRDKCDDSWIGPMKIKELNWTSNYFLKEFPKAKTDFSHCGDIRDVFQDQIQEVEMLNNYRKKNYENQRECEEKARKEKKEMFCQAYGVDMNNDKKANPLSVEDSVMSAALLLSDYRGIYGNLGQALNMAYGENEIFLRSVKNQILAWHKDPSREGILRWPLDPNRSENWIVTSRFKENQSDLTIQSRDGETVFAVGSGVVAEVGSDPSCGAYVKLIHDLLEHDQTISTIYCSVKQISVKKGDSLNIGDEIGKVEQGSLTIKLLKEKVEQNSNEEQKQKARDDSKNRVYMNPEEYITAPDHVIFQERENQTSNHDDGKD